MFIQHLISVCIALINSSSWHELMTKRIFLVMGQTSGVFTHFFSSRKSWICILPQGHDLLSASLDLRPCSLLPEWHFVRWEIRLKDGTGHGDLLQPEVVVSLWTGGIRSHQQRPLLCLLRRFPSAQYRYFWSWTTDHIYESWVSGAGLSLGTLTCSTDYHSIKTKIHSVWDGHDEKLIWMAC